MRVPDSAGERPGGGSYMGATERPGSGSRPLYHHSTYITPKVTKGRKMMGLLPTNQNARVSAPGSFRIPLGMKMSIVIPPRMGSGLRVSKEASAPLTSAVASRCADPYAPETACARRVPAAVGGK